jgi:hypothetical protein
MPWDDKNPYGVGYIIKSHILPTVLTKSSIPTSDLGEWVKRGDGVTEVDIVV